ncbi:DUF2341 domain-containing protein [Nibricoccus sp. IMCC34717]|uniref:DUF2341 domain-containing protein n=1 Tax=Nibricoccus sp. IMCC34717 TaxID=3034021 RepID=UPI00384E30B5
MTSRKLLPLLLTVLLATLLPARASDWWDAKWPIRKQIVIDPSSVAALGREPIRDAVVLVRLHEGTFSLSAAKPDLSDLRFVAADGKTLLTHHVEKIDPLMNEAFVWVRVPEVSGSAKTPIWLYYGHTAEGAPSVENNRGTFLDGTALVYHFSDTVAVAEDSSGNNNSSSSPIIRAEGSLIGSGLRLDGRAFVEAPPSASLAVSAGSAFSWSAWVKPTSGNGILFSQKEGRTGYAIGIEGSVPFIDIVGGSRPGRQRAMGALSMGGWHHVAAVCTGDMVIFYIDGEAAGQSPISLPTINGGVTLGGEPQSPGAGFTGELDEVRLVRAVLTPAQIRFASVAEGPNSSTLVSLGADEQPQGFFHFLQEGYVGVIIGSLTFDAWVVIVLCFIMSIISWLVMIKKAKWLNRIVKGNEVFLKQWHEVSNDLSVIDSEDVSDAQTMGGRITPEQGKVMRESSLYQVYHVGIEEIRHRITQGSGGAPVIKARSIHAIKAMLEGSMIRQTQKLNANMVLLTIAISGGPFLGLLGTVVGVMITFAAVAQAGEVNVNAIAPGIAAALAATCAGLGVAIPALFGYNYLLTRIKSTTTDMTVFIDEFVTKLAEFYGGDHDE